MLTRVRCRRGQKICLGALDIQQIDPTAVFHTSPVQGLDPTVVFHASSQEEAKVSEMEEMKDLCQKAQECVGEARDSVPAD